MQRDLSPAGQAAIGQGRRAGVWSRQDASTAIASLSRGTRINLAGTLVERTAGFALVLVLASILPPVALGGFYEISAIVAVLTTLALLGLDVGVVRATAAAATRERTGEIGPTRTLALCISGACALTIAALVWFAAPAVAARLGQPSLALALRVAVPAIPLAAGAWIVVAPSRGLRSMLPGALALGVVQPMCQLIVTPILLRREPTAESAVWGLLISIAAACVMAIALGGRLGLPVTLAPDRPRAMARTRPLLRFALPVAGMALIDSGLLWIDALILGLYRPSAQVATYGLIARFMTLSLAAMVAISTIFGPLVTRHLERGETRGLEDTLRTATRWAAMISAPILIAVAVFGARVISLLRQPAAGSQVAIAVLAAGFLADACTGPVGNVLTMSGRSALNLANSAVALAANVGLNLLLVPRFGILGAAASWALVIVGINAARVVQVRRLFGISPFGAGLWKPLVAATAAGLAGGLLLHVGVGRAGSAGAAALGPILLALALLAGTYVAAFLALRPHPDDTAFLRNLIGWDGSSIAIRRIRRVAPVSGRAVLGVALGALAVAVGSGIGLETRMGLAAAGGIAALIVTFVVPMPWLAYASLTAFMLFRVVAPVSAGWASYLPDVLAGAVVVRACADRALHRGTTNALRRIVAPLAMLIIVILASSLYHGGGMRSLVATVREFGRLPIWALALAAWGLSWEHAKRMVWLVLGISLVQLPFALHELVHPYNAAALVPGVHFYRGDNIAGTFGLAGSNSAMVFLVLAALTWVALALYRVIPASALWLVAPVLVIPMALGSAAAFAVLLPIPILVLLLRAALTRGARVTVGALAAGLAIVGLVIVGAGSLAKAPGLDASAQTSATSLFTGHYLSEYVDRTTQEGPSTRLGFLSAALHATVLDGAGHALLGRGPETAVIGAKDLQIGPTSGGVLATASVQSVPRMLLGFGLAGLFAYLVLLGASAVPPRLATGDPTARALALVLPVAAGVYALAGIYNAAWSDPGISCAYWTLALAAATGATLNDNDNDNDNDIDSDIDSDALVRVPGPRRPIIPRIDAHTEVITE